MISYTERNNSALNGRHQPPSKPRSPRLLRSRRGTNSNNNSSPSLRHEIPFIIQSSNSMARNNYGAPISRSKSTTRPARAIDEETAITPGRYSVSHHRDLSAHKLVPSKPNKARSVSNSPSAWALSPGRSSPLASMAPSTPKKVEMKITAGGAKVKSGSASVSDVFKFFRIKKVSRIQEEAFHRYRIWHTRLVQWRYVNARAEAAMLAQNSVAEKKICKVMLRIFHLRNSMMDKRIQIQKIKQEIKLRHIVCSESHLLDEWAKIEKRNTEAVGKLCRTLFPLVTRLPLVHCAKGDTFSFYQALRVLMDVMESIEATIYLFYAQVERTASLLKQLVETLAQEKLGLEELAKTRAWIAALQAEEQSLIAYGIQSARIEKSW